MGWQLPSRHAAENPLGTKSPALGLEKKWEPFAPKSSLGALGAGCSLGPGGSGHSAAFLCWGNSWLPGCASGVLRPLPAGPNTWQLRARCSRDLCDPGDSHQRAQRTGNPPRLPLPTPPTHLCQLSPQARGCPSAPSQAWPRAGPLSSSPCPGEKPNERLTQGVGDRQGASAPRRDGCRREDGALLPKLQRASGLGHPRPAGLGQHS